jgi:hypothetical protein
MSVEAGQGKIAGDCVRTEMNSGPTAFKDQGVFARACMHNATGYAAALNPTDDISSLVGGQGRHRRRANPGRGGADPFEHMWARWASLPVSFITPPRPPITTTRPGSVTSHSFAYSSESRVVEGSNGQQVGFSRITASRDGGPAVQSERVWQRPTPAAPATVLSRGSPPEAFRAILQPRPRSTQTTTHLRPKLLPSRSSPIKSVVAQPN